MRIFKLLVPALFLAFIAAAALFFLLPRGLNFTVSSEEIESLPSGTPLIFGEGFTIGEVSGSELFADHVEYQVRVAGKHRDVVNASSKFYFRTRKIEGEKIKVILAETPDPKAPPLKNGAVVKMESPSILDIFR